MKVWTNETWTMDPDVVRWLEQIRDKKLKEKDVIANILWGFGRQFCQKTISNHVPRAQMEKPALHYVQVFRENEGSAFTEDFAPAGIPKARNITCAMIAASKHFLSLSSFRAARNRKRRVVNPVLVKEKKLKQEQYTPRSTIPAINLSGFSREVLKKINNLGTEDELLASRFDIKLTGLSPGNA